MKILVSIISFITLLTGSFTIFGVYAAKKSDHYLAELILESDRLEKDFFTLNDRTMLLYFYLFSKVATLDYSFLPDQVQKKINEKIAKFVDVGKLLSSKKRDLIQYLPDVEKIIKLDKKLNVVFLEFSHSRLTEKEILVDDFDLYHMTESTEKRNCLGIYANFINLKDKIPICVILELNEKEKDIKKEGEKNCIEQFKTILSNSQQIINSYNDLHQKLQKVSINDEDFDNFLNLISKNDISSLYHSTAEIGDLIMSAMEIKMDKNSLLYKSKYINIVSGFENRLRDFFEDFFKSLSYDQIKTIEYFISFKSIYDKKIIKIV